MDAEDKKQEQALKEAIAVDGKDVWDEFWDEIVAQAKRADKEKHISAFFPDREYKVRVQPAQGRLRKAKEVRLRRLTTKGIHVTGSINEHFDFDLRDGKLGVKHNGKPVKASEAAQWIVEQLVRLVQ